MSIFEIGTYLTTTIFSGLEIKLTISQRFQVKCITTDGNTLRRSIWEKTHLVWIINLNENESFFEFAGFSLNTSDFFVEECISSLISLLQAFSHINSSQSAYLFLLLSASNDALDCEIENSIWSVSYMISNIIWNKSSRNPARCATGDCAIAAISQKVEQSFSFQSFPNDK